MVWSARACRVRGQAIVKRIATVLAMVLVSALLSSCSRGSQGGNLTAATGQATLGASARASQSPSSPATSAAVPTPALVAPTQTPVPPTATPFPPTATKVLATATPVPATATRAAAALYSVPACYSAGRDTCNCADFTSTAHAQWFHDTYDPADANRLDADRDGRVCESGTSGSGSGTGGNSGVRVGAICRDGSRSSATGSGACSHHGGVAQWLYR